jgi:hypothetical protein
MRPAFDSYRGRSTERGGDIGDACSLKKGSEQREGNVVREDAASFYILFSATSDFVNTGKEE